MRFLLISCALWVAFDGEAQVTPVPFMADSPKRLLLFEDIKKAAVAAEISPGTGMMEAFEKQAAAYPALYSKVYKTVPDDVRVSRLTQYFKAKASADPDFTRSKVVDLVDFNWDYLGQDFVFYPMRMDIAGDAKLSEVDVAGMKFMYGAMSPKMTRRMLVFPGLKEADAKSLTVTLEQEKGKIVWSGRLDAGVIAVSAAATSRGCEIEVKSTPSGATVLFNGREWHRPTDIRTVRDPGRHEVVVRMEGYKDWKETRFLPPGAAWAINAQLDRR